MTAIAVLIPVLNRPQNVAPLIESASANTTTAHRLLFIASPGEDAEIAALETAGADYVVASFDCGPGDYARKINLGYELTDEPLIFTAADDIRFHPKWAEHAMAKMTGRVAVVGTNDMANPRVVRGLHSTHTLVSRAYVAETGAVWGEPGKLLNDSYPHEFCDEELVGVAKARRVWAYARLSRVEHMHPHWGKAPMDATYEPIGNSRLEEGRAIFNERRGLWDPRFRPRPSRERPIRQITRAGRAGSLIGTPPPPKQRVPVTVITASLPSRTKQLAAAMASVSAQTVEVAHLVSVDASVGVAEARNRLINAASTEWIAFLDDDDVLLPRHVEALLAESDDADVIIPHCKVVGPSLPTGYCNVPFDRETLRAHGHFPITVLARRGALLGIGGFGPSAKWDDWDLWNRMADAGARFVVVPEVTWVYNRGAADSRTKLLQRS